MSREDSSKHSIWQSMAVSPCFTTFLRRLRVLKSFPTLQMLSTPQAMSTWASARSDHVSAGWSIGHLPGPGETNGASIDSPFDVKLRGVHEPPLVCVGSCFFFRTLTHSVLWARLLATPPSTVPVPKSCWHPFRGETSSP